MFDQRAVFAEYLHGFELEGITFLEKIVIFDETWLHYFTPESKQSSMEWGYKGFLPPKKFKTQLLARKIMTGVTLDSERVIYVHFLRHRLNINAQ
jgi:hypothetical protein